MAGRSAPWKITVRMGAQFDAFARHGGVLGVVAVLLLGTVVRSSGGGLGTIGGEQAAVGLRLHPRPSATTALVTPAPVTTPGATTATPGATTSTPGATGATPGATASMRPGGPPALITLPVRVATSDPRLLYDVSPDGSWSAYRDLWAGPGRLHLVGAGRSVDLDIGPTDVLAPQAAAFSPDGRTLAVVDGAGALWSIDVASATPTRIAIAGADGVFGGSVRFGDDQHCFVQLVGSVEIPMPSHLAVVTFPAGEVTILSDDPAAYGPRPLADGSLAYVHLNDDGSYVARRLDPTGLVTDIAEVGFAHGWVDLSVRGAVAFSDGAVTRLVTEPGGRQRSIGAGAYPRFARDGGALVTYDAALHQSRLFGLDGVQLGSAPSPFVAIVPCREGCRP
jgi:hypothetical protein